MKSLTHHVQRHLRAYSLGFIIVVGLTVLQWWTTPQTKSLNVNFGVAPEVEAVADLPPLPPATRVNQPVTELELNAKAAIAIDEATGSILFQKNPDVQLYPASTTKIMTALVALKEYAPTETVTIKHQAPVIGHTAELQPGDQFTVEEMLYAMLVPSGNDAALALGMHHSQGYGYFVSLMNEKARELELQNTNFTNVSGLESITHYTSARDLSKITQYALKNPLFRKVVQTESIEVSASNTTRPYTFQNLNQLLTTVAGVQGVKTGWTPAAGECLVTYTVRDGNGIIAVILGSPDRFGESEKLIEWTFSNYLW